MGPLDEIMKMIPGMANNPQLKNVNMNPKDMDHLKAIVYSMTEQERTDPDVLNPSRRRRIARGSGRPVQEVNRMIKQFTQMKTMMNKVSKGNMSGMENMMNSTGMGGKNVQTCYEAVQPQDEEEQETPDEEKQEAS